MSKGAAHCSIPPPTPSAAPDYPTNQNKIGETMNEERIGYRVYKSSAEAIVNGERRMGGIIRRTSVEGLGARGQARGRL